MSQPSVSFNGVVPQYMPAQPIATAVVEKSTLILAVGFQDENGSGTVASGVVWSLTDEDGNVINSRSDVVASGSGSAMTIVLTGLDTELQALKADGFSDDGARQLVVKGFYNSPTNGNGLNMTGEFRFVVLPIPSTTVT
jgi:hypothetical protein